MIPAAISKLLAACDVTLTVTPTADERFDAVAHNSGVSVLHAVAAPGDTAREAALSALDALHLDAKREDAENAAAFAQLVEDAASTSRREAATVRAATWRVRAATLGAVCREAAKLWPEVSL